MMSDTIRVMACLGTNIVGFLIMLTLLMSRGWRIQTKNSESRILLAMILSVMIGTGMDPLGMVMEGKEGALARFVVYSTNWILFAMNMIVGPGFVALLAKHINEKFSEAQKRAIGAICLFELALLIVNLFEPVVFHVDENNYYHRDVLYGAFVVIEAGLLYYGLLIYFSAKRKGSLLYFFPAWQFFVPIAVGMLLQGMFLGVSLIWPCVGIGFCGVAFSLQNESIFLDKLTGVYNRYYLEEIKKILVKRKKGRFAAMMLDMNDFKSINDNYSHAEGDAALVTIADILIRTVQKDGVVIRFAGDEFVIILIAENDNAVEEYRAVLQKELDAYNVASGKPYQLAVAVGGRVYEMTEDQADSFLDEIDRLMYTDKSEYYKAHNRRRG